MRLLAWLLSKILGKDSYDMWQEEQARSALEAMSNDPRIEAQLFPELGSELGEECYYGGTGSGPLENVIEEYYE